MFTTYWKVTAQDHTPINLRRYLTALVKTHKGGRLLGWYEQGEDVVVVGAKAAILCARSGYLLLPRGSTVFHNAFVALV